MKPQEQIKAGGKAGEYRREEQVEPGRAPTCAPVLYRMLLAVCLRTLAAWPN